MKNKLRLVIVDDEAYIRNNLKDLFPWDNMGYTVVSTFSNGAKALNFLHQKGADVVLTDIQMPVLDGLGLAKAIQEAGFSTSVVLLSAYSDFEYARRGMAHGVVDYMVKPVCYAELVDIFTSLHSRLAGSDTESADGGDIMSRILHYVEDHIDSVTLESTADFAGLSTDYVSRMFRRQNSLSFAEFVHQTRMMQAGLLVRRIDLPISHVAESLGYHNSKNFSRAFHTFYGCTPMEYRKQRDLSPGQEETSPIMETLTNGADLI